MTGTSIGVVYQTMDDSTLLHKRKDTPRARPKPLPHMAETVTAASVAAANLHSGQQGPVLRQDSAESDFSQSSSSSWDKPQSKLSGTQQKLQLHELIGRGAFGSVYRGTWKGQPAAIKVVEHGDGLLGDLDEFDDLVTPTSGSQLETTGSSMGGSAGIVMEAAVSSAVMHPNVVQTYNYHTQQSALTGGQETYVVMEWCEGGSLEAAVERQLFHIRSCPAWAQQADVLRIAATLLDIASGIAYLHQMHIVHRDLKLKNVLLKFSQVDWRGFTVKVSDFGLSQLIPETPAQTGLSSGECNGTVTYLAPEVLAGSTHTAAADVYAFGILMYELWTGLSAFPGMSKMQIMIGVVSSGMRPTFPTSCPMWYSSLAAACWAPSPTKRPSATLLIQHFLEINAALS